MHYPPVTPMDKAWGLQVLCLDNTNTLLEQRPVCLVDENGLDLWKVGRVLPHYQISYIMEGRGAFRSEQAGEVELCTGDMFLMFPGVWHAFAPDENTGWDEYYVRFEGVQADRLLEYQIISHYSPIFRLGSTPVVGQLFREMHEVVVAQPMVENRILASMLGVILAHAVNEAGVYADAGAGRDPQFSGARTYLEEHHNENVDVCALARSVGTSYPVLRRLFHAATGLAPHKYHLHLRINRAKEMLENPEFRVKDVARMLGFEDESYFSRVFRREVGCSPTEWKG